MPYYFVLSAYFPEPVFVSFEEVPSFLVGAVFSHGVVHPCDVGCGEQELCLCVMFGQVPSVGSLSVYFLEPHLCDDPFCVEHDASVLRHSLVLPRFSSFPSFPRFSSFSSFPSFPRSSRTSSFSRASSFSVPSIIFIVFRILPEQFLPFVHLVHSDSADVVVGVFSLVFEEHFGVESCVFGYVDCVAVVRNLLCESCFPARFGSEYADYFHRMQIFSLANAVAYFRCRVFSLSRMFAVAYVRCCVCLLSELLIPNSRSALLVHYRLLGCG